jgi:UDP-N-acetylmuramate--alanine ligase
MKHIHLIGIGGTGISSIARVLLERGYTVSGSDRILSSLALDLRKSGVKVFEGHNAANIQGADLVVRSSAVPDENVEVAAALAAGIPVLKRSDFLGKLMENDACIAVAGSHGKTTTSAMLAWTLTRLDLDPSYILGGVSKNLVSNAHAGKGKYFVIEADEYDRMFLGLNPAVILVTNVEYDHPDCYPTRDAYLEAFKDFVKRLKPQGILAADGDHSRSASLLHVLPGSACGCTYGLTNSVDYQAINLSVNEFGGMSFEVVSKASAAPFARVQLQVPGEHNVRNALGVLSVIHQLGLPVDKAGAALAEFTGTGRRFDIVDESHGITVISDYAHHPTKISATLAAARQRFPSRRLVAVWQPHTYSRTRALENEFIESLKNADLVVVTEIYASREKPEAYSSRKLVEQITAIEAKYVPTLQSAVDFLSSALKPGDVLIVLSAGDADQICPNVLARLNERKG